MNPYLTQRANRRWWVYPLMALFFALSALLLWRTCKAGEHGDTRMVLLLLCLATAALYAGMHLLQGEIIRRRARGIAQQLATFSLHCFRCRICPSSCRTARTWRRCGYCSAGTICETFRLIR